MEIKNPIAAKLAQSNQNQAEQTDSQQVNTPETPAAPNEQAQETQHQETPQTEEATENNESNSQQEQTDESQREQEATALETVDDGNASETPGTENGEGQAASESSSENWFDDEDDSAENQDTPETLPEGDYSAIGKALGLESADGEAVLGKVKEISSQNQELQNKIKNLEENSNFATPELEQANEVARNGGDYLSLLGLTQNNWDAVPDDVLLVEGKLKGVFGEDEEGMLSYLNEMDNVQKKVMANEIRQGLKDNDEYQKQEIVKKSQERRRKTDEGIKKVLDGTNEAYGLKLTPSMKTDLYKRLTGGDFIKEIFHDKDGNPDPAKMVNAAIALGNVKKIAKIAHTKGLNEGTGQILDEVTQPNVQRQGKMVDPQPRQEMSPLDKRMASLRGTGQKK